MRMYIARVSVLLPQPPTQKHNAGPKTHKQAQTVEKGETATAASQLLLWEETQGGAA